MTRETYNQEGPREDPTIDGLPSEELQETARTNPESPSTDPAYLVDRATDPEYDVASEAVEAAFQNNNDVEEEALEEVLPKNETPGEKAVLTPEKN